MTVSTSLLALQTLLTLEGGLFKEQSKAPNAQRLNKVRVSLLNHVRQTGKSGDLALMVATEKAIVEDELVNHANSKGMASSLNAALAELAATEKLLTIVDDEARYRQVNQSCSLSKNREKGLPLDEARQAFKSRYARLNNLDRVRLSDDEKAIIDARKSNMFQAGKLYAQRQARTLGVTTGQRQGVKR
jgi:hypothetical protein